MSVTDAEEARIAVDAGVDIVDVKNLAEGLLGAPAPGVIGRIRESAPPERPVSAAIGHLPTCPAPQRWPHWEPRAPAPRI